MVIYNVKPNPYEYNCTIQLYLYNVTNTLVTIRLYNIAESGIHLFPPSPRGKNWQKGVGSQDRLVMLEDECKIHTDMISQLQSNIFTRKCQLSSSACIFVVEKSNLDLKSRLSGNCNFKIKITILSYSNLLSSTSLLC